MFRTSLLLLLSCLLLEILHPAVASKPFLRINNDIERENAERRLDTDLDVIGNNGGDGFPLGECEGDCDSDDECQGDLKCFQRSGNEKVPGCSGDHSHYKGVDFCYKDDGDDNDDEDDDDDNGSGNGFRLKLYWQEGYYWQEETRERKWCMECRGSCREGKELVIHECDSGSTEFQFVGSSFRKQIKVAGKDLCFELKGDTAIELEECDASNSKQRFGPGAGNFAGRRFEISPSSGRCLSQKHHPRDGENVYSQSCTDARRDTTSYWNIY